MFSALLAGGLSALGGLTDSISGMLSPFLGMASARDTNRTMRQIAAQNREWMEKMSNTAHQREVKDLRSAGLNPILSAGGLQGASTPSVSTDYSQHAYTPDFSGVGKGLVKVGEAASIFSSVKNTEANTALQEAQKAVADSQVMKNRADVALSNSAANLNQFKAVTEGHEARLKAIEAKYRDDKLRLGTEIAASNRRKAIADADVATANALFRLSPDGHSAYRLNAWNKPFVGLNQYLYPLMRQRQATMSNDNDNADPKKRYYLIRDGGVFRNYQKVH